MATAEQLFNRRLQYDEIMNREYVLGQTLWDELGNSPLYRPKNLWTNAGIDDVIASGDFPLFHPTGMWNADHVMGALNVAEKAISLSHDKLNPEYAEHIVLTGLMYRQLLFTYLHETGNTAYMKAEQINSDLIQAEVMGYLHDIEIPVVVDFLTRNMLTSHEARRVGIRMNVEDHLDPVIAEVAFGKRVTSVNDLTIEQILHRIADNTMKGEYKVLNIGSVEQNIKTNLETHAARGGSSPKKYDGAWKTNNIGRERLDDGVSLTSQELTREAIQWFERETGKSIANVQNQVLRMYRQGPYKEWAERMKKTYFPRVNHIQEQEETIHPPIELILFDAGNVLIDDPGNRLWERVWDKLQEKGLINPNLKQRYDAFVNPKDVWTKNKKKKSSVSIKTFLPGTLNDSVSEDEFYTQFFRHIDIAKPDTETIHYLFDNPDLYQPIPGMQELVADLAARGIRIGVLSDCSSIVNQTVKNRILSLYGNWIEEADVLMSSEIKTAKADDDTLAFVHARNHFRIDNPRRMIFVDDKAIFTGKAGLEYIPAHRFTKTEQLNHYLASKKFVSRATLQ